MSAARPGLLQVCRTWRSTKPRRFLSSPQACNTQSTSVTLQSLSCFRSPADARFSSTTALRGEASPHDPSADSSWGNEQALRFLAQAQDHQYLTEAENQERARLYLQQQEAQLQILQLKRTEFPSPSKAAAAEFQRVKAVHDETWDQLVKQLQQALQRQSSEKYEAIIAETKERAQAEIKKVAARQEAVGKKLSHLSRQTRALRQSLVEEQRQIRSILFQLRRQQRSQGGQLADADQSRLANLNAQLSETRAQLQDLARKRPTLNAAPRGKPTTLTGTVTRTGTMHKTVRVTQKTQTWNKQLQKHYSAKIQRLVHDPEEITIEGDVVTIGLFTPEIREQREKLGKIGKGRIEYMIKEIVTPFGKTVEERRSQRAVAAGAGEDGVEEEWKNKVAKATKAGKKRQGVLAKGRQKKNSRIVVA
ncbi:hypothetical protein PV10_00119 [Exophiala mesophila]|uniref:Uncharacterized protein n=1 Tax=Exophiala mesophila TaxID=212818 RepID=A0A0D1ZQG8_EXOME|nr:uncharacterized protein PV10_00119 [Exophiala mesophila]KIV96229.1 hypothetical protein PV10_00119 [Exophiala mesophila]